MTHTAAPADYKTQLIEAILEANPHNPDQPNIATITCNIQGPQWAGINLPIKRWAQPKILPPGRMGNTIHRHSKKLPKN